VERANHPPRFYVYCIKILKTVEWIQFKVSSLSIEIGTLNLYQIGPHPLLFASNPLHKTSSNYPQSLSKIGPHFALVTTGETWLSLEDQNFSSILCLRAIYLFWFCNTCFELESPGFIGMVYSFLASFFVNVAEFLGYLLNLVCFFFVNVSLMLRDPPGSIKCPKYSTGILT